MQDWGYEVFATILLPGVVIATAAWLVVSEEAPGSPLNTWMKNAAANQWSFLFIAAVVSTLLGHVVAAIVHAIESIVFDKFRAWRMKVSLEEFASHWERYIDWLSDGSNSYVSRTARRLWFESRMAFALAILGATLLWWRHSEWWMTVGVFAAAGVLLVLALRTHRILAEWRMRNARAGRFVRTGD